MSWVKEKFRLLRDSPWLAAALAWLFVALVALSSPLTWDETLEFFWLRDAKTFSSYLSSCSSAVCASWFQFTVQGAFYKTLLAIAPRISAMAAIEAYKILVLGALYAVAAGAAWEPRDRKAQVILIMTVLPLLTVQSISYGTLARWYGLAMPITILWTIFLEREPSSSRGNLTIAFLSAMPILVSYANMETEALVLAYVALFKPKRMKKKIAPVAAGAFTGWLLDRAVRTLIRFRSRGCLTVKVKSLRHREFGALVWSSGKDMVSQVFVRYGFWAIGAIVLLLALMAIKALLLDGGANELPSKLAARIAFVVAVLWGIAILEHVLMGQDVPASHNWPLVVLLGLFLVDAIQLGWAHLKDALDRKVMFSGLIVLMLLNVAYQAHAWGRKTIDRPGFDGKPLSGEIVKVLEGNKNIEIYSPAPAAPISLLRAYLEEEDATKKCTISPFTHPPEKDDYFLMQVTCNPSRAETVKYVLFANCDPKSPDPEKYGWRLAKYVPPGWRGWSRTCLYRFVQTGK